MYNKKSYDGGWFVGAITAIVFRIFMDATTLEWWAFLLIAFLIVVILDVIGQSIVRAWVDR